MKDLKKKILFGIFLSFLVWPAFSFAQGTSGNTIDYFCSGGSANGFGTAGGVWDNNEAALAGCTSACVGGTCSPQISEQTCINNGQTLDTATNTCVAGTANSNNGTSPNNSSNSNSNSNGTNPPDFSNSNGTTPSCPAGKICNPITTKTLNEFIQTILVGAIKIGIPIIALAIIFCGFMFVKARGNPEAIQKAKDALIYTLIGAAILLGAWAIAQLISNTILNL